MKRPFSTSATVRAKVNPSRFIPLSTLSSSDIAAFRASYFQPQLPVILPRGQFSQLPAIQKWFSIDYPSHGGTNAPSSVRSLNYTYLGRHSNCSVPLELTSSSPDSPDTPQFQRFYAPLDLFLKWTKTTTGSNPSNSRLYLAQCQLLDLPQDLHSDFPTPLFVSEAGRGDIYDTNIWMGIPPTYTPFHRDPNPNLFVQMAGRKAVRLYSPDTGLAVFQRVKAMVLWRQSQDENAIIADRVVADHAKFRGEEMMQGLEKTLLEAEVWGSSAEREPNEADGGGASGSESGISREVEDEATKTHGFEAHLDAGDGMFIPMGWWHSIKGVGEGITASVNWWFR
ncbi:hypothetical protein PAAG_04394 [Paracoccidioides lutzii Pb01]|uniref:JmjC domain-containing protein n=1 Tax=Paracoccidioides lutzii (strain ATCC MYA-826 / Pb01) TaxID=502779 RepID=C1H0V0_PARBA|nr:hypothetical protein PAAG_04394 [Paracoccidioides lutzii Pb01]EEH33344.1 hypothetical protein PAAG_04394 [Paracoccidioides lutzii Pb01]